MNKRKEENAFCRISISVSLPRQIALATLLSQTHLPDSPLLSNMLIHLSILVLIEGLEIEGGKTYTELTYIHDKPD